MCVSAGKPYFSSVVNSVATAILVFDYCCMKCTFENVSELVV